MKKISPKTYIFLAITGLPVFIYPAILIAGIMSLAAIEALRPHEIVMEVPVIVFILSTLVYPYIYIDTLIKFIRAKRASSANPDHRLLRPIYINIAVAIIAGILGLIVELAAEYLA